MSALDLIVGGIGGGMVVMLAACLAWQDERRGKPRPMAWRPRRWWP